MSGSITDIRLLLIKVHCYLKFIAAVKNSLPIYMGFNILSRNCIFVGRDSASGKRDLIQNHYSRSILPSPYNSILKVSGCFSRI